MSGDDATLHDQGGWTAHYAKALLYKLRDERDIERELVVRKNGLAPHKLQVGINK